MVIDEILTADSARYMIHHEISKRSRNEMTLSDLDRIEACADYLASVFRAIYPTSTSSHAFMVEEDWHVQVGWNDNWTQFTHTDTSDGDGMFRFVCVGASDHVVQFPIIDAWPGNQN